MLAELLVLVEAGEKKEVIMSDGENRDIVSCENLSTELLMDLFKGAYINVSERQGENQFLITEHGLKVIVNFETATKRWIRFVVLFGLDSLSQAEAMAYVNKINQQLILIRGQSNDQVFAFDYYLWTEGGVTKKDIILTYKQFVAATLVARSLFPQTALGKAA